MCGSARRPDEVVAVRSDPPLSVCHLPPRASADRTRFRATVPPEGRGAATASQGVGHDRSPGVPTGRVEVLRTGRRGGRAPARAGRACQDGEPDRGQQAAGAVHAAVRGAAGDRRARRWRRQTGADRQAGLDPPRVPDDDLRLRPARTGADHPRPDDPRPARHAADGDAGQQAADGTPVPQLRPVDLDAPARLGVEAAVRRVRQRHHQGRPDQALRLPEQAGRPDALVPRPRRAPHRRERLHGPGGPVPPARRRREGTEHPEVDVGRPAGDRPVRPAADPGRQDVQLERRVPLRRRRAHRPVGRRRPRQRRAVAEPQGQEAALPLPDPERLDLAGLPAAAEQQRRRSA